MRRALDDVDEAERLLDVHYLRGAATLRPIDGHVLNLLFEAIAQFILNMYREVNNRVEGSEHFVGHGGCE